MKKIGIIPARMGSSRFPGKPMESINDMPMIGHVYKRSTMSKNLDEVYVATCDEVIKEYIESIGGKAIMTKDTHERATDRTAEAIAIIEKSERTQVSQVVLIQGDEPMVTPDMIDASIDAFNKLDNPTVLNLFSKISSVKEFMDPNEIKTIMNKDFTKAISFSREPIPNNRANQDLKYAYKQVCIMPFTKDFLYKFNELQPTELEIIESIDMMRVLEHGYEVYMAKSPHVTFAVDTQDDLNHVARLMEDDQLTKSYM